MTPYSKPSTSADKHDLAYVVKPLLDFISKVESGGRYNAVYGNARSPVDLSQFSLGYVIFRAKERGRRSGSSATGRYQMLAKTMLDVAERMGIPMTDLFTPELQDRMALDLLRRRYLKSYLAGTRDTAEFAHSLSKEWASLPAGPHGRSYYAGDAIGNKALVSWEALNSVLRETRRRYHND